ncbi:hypothetical protein ACFZB9_13680 [Kitasatospora sp. NPDC008050]|uniref:hypothetical protein n=1 Tax=Kitasatospora sp. NPDC008050 TaxID=3364021 RepID=UPI0036ED043A
MTTGVQRRTLAEYRAEQRGRAPAWDPLDDYDPAEADRRMRARSSTELPPCACGRPGCSEEGGRQ